MGKLISFGRCEKPAPQFVLVLAGKELDWLRVARQLELDQSRLVASYYLLEQLGMLRQGNLLSDYAACILVGVDGISSLDKQELEWLSLQMPMLTVKESDNIFDLGLDQLCQDSLSSEQLPDIDFGGRIAKNIGTFRAGLARARHSERTQRGARTGSAGQTSMAVADADFADAEHFVAGTVESLRVVARTRGISLDWEPQGESLPVLLHKQQAKRHLIDLFLEIFDVYTNVKVMTSPRSLMCEDSVWLDIEASCPRFSDRFVPELSEAFMSLRKTLRLNHGDTFLVDQGPDAIVIRLEWQLSHR